MQADVSPVGMTAEFTAGAGHAEPDNGFAHPMEPMI